MTLKYDKKRARSVLGTGRPHSFSPFGQANHEPANLEYGPRFLDIPPPHLLVITLCFNLYVTR